MRRLRISLFGALLALLQFGQVDAAAAQADVDSIAGDQVSEYAEALVAQALSEKVDEERAWLRLLHYRPRPIGTGFRSQADGDRFFLSPFGRTSPRRELLADLRGFFQPPIPELPVGEAGPPRHPICRFPARLAYLAKRLSIDSSKLPQQRCPRFTKFLQDLNPRSVTVAFSSYYLNNPSSAFGHTFLRFNKASQAVGEKRELLDYAVNFAADVDTTNALIYAFKGLFGLFPGTAKRLPYYYKVREYADTESRDIWEYELSFTPEQLYTLVAHVWEIGSTYFAYFYLDENCSYRINLMLEAANPELDLTSKLGPAVLPADTVKALFDNPGLVRDVGFRPSLRRQFLASVAPLDGEQQDLVEELVVDAEKPFPSDWLPVKRVPVLDAALDLVDVRHVKDLVFKTNPEAAAKKQRLLERRASYQVPSRRAPIEVPHDERPDKGHGSMRLALGAGYRNADGDGTFQRGFGQLGFRLALHDLADPVPGYPDLSQIEFLPMALRVWRHKGAVRLSLDEASLVRIVSLTSVNRYDLSISWHVDAGVRSLENEGCQRCFGTGVDGGAGFAKGLFDNALVGFAMADIDVKLTSRTGAGIADSIVRAGVGPAAGLRVRFAPELVWLTRGRYLFYPTQTGSRVFRLDSYLRWGLTDGLALDLRGRAQSSQRELVLSLMAYR